ncbi:YveK family protein [Turicibacter sanguinis]|uniref:YveK family protein n=1 Tax=Turicibacter sanguinis TaxID=154288 RepID=UPI0018AC6C2C|nr:Wzz/FepE/Etk N-terminal domain-containing protein [Turicibacter sanguinis]MDB8558390.1 Wzz/FepE/Etk N-terminal domain-containing protein [Turicibacter sanguinis]MDB8561186.1 Wzz/FepE/Etk N-terminal domain-containing protein [Turicibacter sanguinis]
MQIAEKGIDLYEYVDLLKKRWWIIAVLMVLFGGLMGYRTYKNYVPVYQTSTTLLMHYKTTGSTTSSRDFSVGSNVISTLTGMLNSQSMRSQIAEELGSHSLGNISVSAGDGSLVKLSVTHTNAESAAAVANKTATVLISMVKKMMSDIDLSVLDEARVPYVTSGMALNRNITIGAMVGMVLGIGIILLLEVLDTTFKTPKEVESELGIPIMGVIPNTDIELAKYRATKVKEGKNDEEKSSRA